MTPSLRTSSAAYFYPRPPRGGRRNLRRRYSSAAAISIHALREEGDATGCLCVSVSHNFYPRPPRGGRRNLLASLADGILFLSTPSARRATVPRLSGFVEVTISIHALREEGDSALHTRLRCAGTISIHALREEGDNRVCCSQTDDGDFYPRPPRGGRRVRRRTRRRLDKFISTPSARRATRRF